jgi:PAS domain S-box-containing protein
MCVSQNDIVLACNFAATTLFGYKLEEIVGNSSALFYPSETEFAWSHLQASKKINSNINYFTEQILRRCDGLFWCRVHRTTLTFAGGADKQIWTFTEVGSLTGLYQLLSPRERELAALLVAGNTSKMIANKVGLSCRTIEFYRGRLMQKLSVNSSSELVTVLATGRSALAGI